MAKRIDDGTLVGAWTPAVVALFARLGSKTKKEALKLLNHDGGMPRRVEGLNRAVHYIVRLEIRGKNEVKRALADVAKSWGVSAGTVKEDRTKFHVKKRSPFAPTDAWFIAEQIIAGCSINRRMTRAAVLEAFDADMRNRAKKLRAAKK